MFIQRSLPHIPVGKKFLLTGTLLCAFTTIAAPAWANEDTRGDKAPRKFALIVGVSEYERPGIEIPWPNLSCATDLTALRHLLLSRFGFAEDNILTLTDAKATRAGIIKAFREQLIAKARPGDVLLFHFSGHGQPVADDNGDELDGLDESLVPYDYISQSARSGATTNIRDDEIGELLGELRKKMQDPSGQVQGNITILLDSCHSGTATRGRSARGRLRVRGRGWNTAMDGPKPVSTLKNRGTEAVTPPREGASGLFVAGGARAQGYVVISACESDQLAQETENEQGQGMGAFTYFLTRSLANATPGTTYRDVFERVNVEMAGAVENQNPQLEGEIDKALFGNATLPSPPYFVVSAATSEGLTLPLGSLQGLTVGSRFALYKAGSDVDNEANRLAEAEIVSVDTVTSRARPLTEVAAVKLEDLKAARAVETLRNYGPNQLKVWIDESDASNLQVLEAALAKVPAITTEAVTATNYDIRIRRDGTKLLLERSTGYALSALNIEGIAALLREALLGEWRWKFLTRLRNDNPRSLVKMEMRLIRVDATTDATGRVTKVIGDHKEATIQEGSRNIFRDGDFVMLELRNPSEADAYVTVLDLAADGSINPVFPHPDSPGVFDNKIPADKQWHRITGTPDNPFVLRLGAPFGNELFKAIATRENADFSSLLSAPTVTQRGENSLLKDLPPEVNPLAQLLLTSVTGKQRGSRFAGVPPTNWSSADYGFEVRPR